MPTPIARSYGPPSTAPSAPSDSGRTDAPQNAVGQPASPSNSGFGPIASTPPRPSQAPATGRSRTEETLKKLRHFSDALRQRAADRIMPRTPGTGRHRREASVSYSAPYPTGGAGTQQPYAQNFRAMTSSPSRTAGYLKAGLKWGALATMPIAFSLIGMSAMPSIGGAANIMYPFLALGAMNAFMMGAATGMSMHRAHSKQTQWLAAFQAHQQQMLAAYQAALHQMQPGMPQQPQAYQEPQTQQPSASVNPRRVVPSPPAPPSPAPRDLRVWPPAVQEAAQEAASHHASANQRAGERRRPSPSQPSDSGFYLSLPIYRPDPPAPSENEPDRDAKSPGRPNALG